MTNTPSNNPPEPALTEDQKDGLFIALRAFGYTTAQQTYVLVEAVNTFLQNNPKRP